jgi:hypothetical protein
MPKRAQQRLGVATLIVLAAVGAALFLRRTPGPRAADCEHFVDRYAAVYGQSVGPEYAELLRGRRDAIVGVCRRYATPAFVECVRTASDVDALARCSEHGLRAWPSADVPTAAACESQADWRIAVHAQVELPSIARGIAETRDDMVETCMQHWSAAYVDCLAGAPSLGFAQACETVGRVRTIRR